MDEKRRERLSKLLSLMLRHKPEMFDLELDSRGYASLEAIVKAARQKFNDVTDEEILDIVNGPEKRRFEMQDGLIRARYGHSFPIDLGLDPIDPPEFLYYATVPGQVRAITQGGLQPFDRQFVHLSLTSDIASDVASRRTETPVTFKIKAREAAAAGIAFYDRTPVILTEGVPGHFIEILNESDSSLSPLYGRRKRLKSPRVKFGPTGDETASEASGTEA